jgi:hypothetical protein
LDEGGFIAIIYLKMGAFFKGTDSASPDTISKKNLGREGVLPTPEKKYPLQ